MIKFLWKLSWVHGTWYILYLTNCQNLKFLGGLAQGYPWAILGSRAGVASLGTKSYYSITLATIPI